TAARSVLFELRSKYRPWYASSSAFRCATRADSNRDAFLFVSTSRSSPFSKSAASSARCGGSKPPARLAAVAPDPRPAADEVTADSAPLSPAPPHPVSTAADPASPVTRHPNHSRNGVASIGPAGFGILAAGAPTELPAPPPTSGHV